jgi:chromosome segregation ATPase
MGCFHGLKISSEALKQKFAQACLTAFANEDCSLDDIFNLFQKLLGSIETECEVKVSSIKQQVQEEVIQVQKLDKLNQTLSTKLSDLQGELKQKSQTVAQREKEAKEANHRIEALQNNITVAEKEFRKQLEKITYQVQSKENENKAIHNELEQNYRNQVADTEAKFQASLRTGLEDLHFQSKPLKTQIRKNLQTLFEKNVNQLEGVFKIFQDCITWFEIEDQKCRTENDTKETEYLKRRKEFESQILQLNSELKKCELSFNQSDLELNRANQKIIALQSGMKEQKQESEKDLEIRTCELKDQRALNESMQKELQTQIELLRQQHCTAQQTLSDKQKDNDSLQFNLARASLKIDEKRNAMESLEKNCHTQLQEVTKQRNEFRTKSVAMDTQIKDITRVLSETTEKLKEKEKGKNHLIR